MYCCPIWCFYVYFFVCVNVLLLVPNHSIHSDKVKACVEIKQCKKQDIRYPQIKSKASWISLNSFLFPKTYNPPHSYLIEVWSIPCFNCYWSRTISAGSNFVIIYINTCYSWMIPFVWGCFCKQPCKLYTRINSIPG